jgi:hypothetical protein
MGSASCPFAQAPEDALFPRDPLDRVNNVPLARKALRAR